MKKLLSLTAICATILCGCAGKTTADGASDKEQTATDSMLIIYYSQTGTTKAVAETFQKNLGCRIVEIQAVEPYDSDYEATVERWRSEKDEGVKVAIQPVDVNLDDYKVIFLGFPIWGGTYASPMATFIADNALAGKMIVPFATFGSGGIETAAADIRRAQPDAQVAEGYGVRNALSERSLTEVPRFLAEKGFIEGDYESLPEYSAPADVTAADVEVFEAACGDYRFPLGTPVKVSKRVVSEGTDYRFDVRAAGASDNDPLTTIYVIAAGDSKPVFTRVVRP